MSNSLQPLDLKELRSSQKGEGLEGLTRRLGSKLNLIPEQSGRGTDNGRDLYFHEIYRDQLTNVTIKWLVSCKDYAESGKSVSEKDLSNNLALKLQEHKCSGFLLVTTTVASTGVKTLLDSLDRQHGGDYYTRVWDETDLRAYLLEPKNSDLLKQFFPDSYLRVKEIDTLSSALERFRNEIPPAIYSLLIAKLPTLEDKTLHGTSIWPEDSDAANQIDLVIRALQFQENVNEAQRLCEELGTDAFVAMVSALLKKDKESAFLLLKSVVSESTNSGIRSNATQYLLDMYDVNEDEYEISETMLSLEEEDFEHVILDRFSDNLGYEIINNSEGSNVESEINSLGGIAIVDWVDITNVKSTKFDGDEDEYAYFDFEGKMSVSFTITVDNDHDTERSYSLPGQFTATYDIGGFHLTGASVDTASFYGDEDEDDYDYYDELEEQEDHQS